MFRISYYRRAPSLNYRHKKTCKPTYSGEEWLTEKEIKAEAESFCVTKVSDIGVNQTILAAKEMRTYGRWLIGEGERSIA